MAPPRKPNGSLDFKGMIQDGENPNGCIGQTADGTMRNYDSLGRQDYKWNQQADGERWNNGFMPKPDMLDTAVPVGKSPNRKRKS